MRSKLMALGAVVYVVTGVWLVATRPSTQDTVVAVVVVTVFLLAVAFFAVGLTETKRWQEDRDR